MKVSLKLPLFGMNMEEATVSRWCKRAGDVFVKGEPLYEIETEKVTSEVEAPCNGTLLEMLAPEESVVKVGDAVCHIDMEPNA
ncbi:MAG: lipoyl domain-containing protein [Burkholderiales bacterium]